MAMIYTAQELNKLFQEAFKDYYRCGVAPTVYLDNYSWFVELAPGS